MHAFNAWKKRVIEAGSVWRRWASDILDTLTSGALWTRNGTVVPPLMKTCAFDVCSNGTCVDCILSTTEKKAALRADQQRHEQSKCCSFCMARGTLLLGGQVPVCRDCSNQAEALGLFAPHTCRGVGDKGCAGNGSRDSHSTLCTACACTVLCEGVDGKGCPTSSRRDGHDLLCANCVTAKQCDGVDGTACVGNGSRDSHARRCKACACTVPCKGVDGTGCPTISFRNGHDLLCKQCNAAKKGKHPTAPRSRPPAAIGKRSPYVCKKCGLLKKGHVCTVKE